MFAWLRRRYRQWRLKRLMDGYLGAGELFGEMISFYMVMGEALGFRSLLALLVERERLYVDAGYRPISVSQWEEWGGYGENEPVLGVLRDAGEAATYPVAEYANAFVLVDDSTPIFVDDPPSESDKK